MAKRFFLLLNLLMIGHAIASSAVVRGSVRDDQGESLPEATVRILAATDSTYIKGGATNADGRFRIEGLNKGKYILQVNYIGYSTVNQPLTIDADEVRVKPIVMSESSVLLKEATVVGVKTPIKVMEDTIEYNSDSYRTQPNAVVEDLLKRLPGVEVDNTGKITANGKEVTKILVDGKEFFSDDPKVASRNLPVDMVDKLQVVDRKSDLARLTGVDDGEDETVINLTVKKGMKNGWFGTVEAGYGTDDRYQTTFNINRFVNNNQFTILGGANNTNDLGFSDGNGNRFRRFGGDRGINTSQTLGLNFNVGNDEIFRVGGNILYSHSDRDTRTRSNRQYLFPDSVSYNDSYKQARDRGNNIRADFRIEWKPDSFNTLDFRPRLSFNHNNAAELDSSLTLAGTMQRVTRSFNSSNSKGNSFELGGNLIYNHNFKQHRGRSYSFNMRYQLSNVREHTNSYSHNLFYLFNDSIDAYDQYSNDHTWSNFLQARASWTEPLGDPAKGRFLTLSYQFSYRWNNADKLTYDRELLWPDGPWGEPLVLPELNFVDTLSNSFRNNFFNQNIRIGFKLVKKAYTLDAGLALVPSMSRSTDLINSQRNIPERWVWNYAPFLRMRFKLSKTRSLNAFYNGRSSQPSMAQLQPVADYSNPLRVVIGNPNLDPTFTHSLNVRFQDFDRDRQRSLMLMLFTQVAQNSIVSRTDFNPQTGGQVTTYANVNGVWSARLMNMLSMPLRNKAFSFSNHIFANANHNVGFNNGRRNNSMSVLIMESPALTWRPDKIEIELRPRYSLQYTHNSLPSMSTPTVHTYGGTFNGSYYAPFGLVLSTDLSYSANHGYAAGYNTNEWMWNASISYQFLKARNATVALKVYDLLQQKSNVSRNVTANYIDDSLYNSLTRYFMVTFTYKFNTFGAGKEPQSRGFGPGGFGGPGGPPPGMGPGRR